MPHFRPWLLRSLLANVSVALVVSGCGASTNNGGPSDTGGQGVPDAATTGSGGIEGKGGMGGGGTGGAVLGTGGNTRTGGTTGTGSGGNAAGGAKSGGAGGAKSGGAGGAKSGGASGGGRAGGAGLDGQAGAGGMGNGGGGKGGATPCGTIAGLGCPTGSFCEFPAATCGLLDNAGVCRVRPDICSALYAPVCGCDGKTYSNDCGRQGMGISKATDGACATGAGGAGGAGGASMTATSYAGCRFVGGIDRLVIAKYDAQTNQCVALVLADNSGIPAFTGLTITAPWYAESANFWPSTSGDCARRDAPSGAFHATSGSGTVTVAASSSTITVDATLTFRAGDSGAPQTADLKRQGVSTSPACP